MFGFGVRTDVTADHLLVNSPINVLLLLALALPTIWPLAIFCFQKPLPRRKVIGWAIFTLLVFGLLPSGARLTLDRKSGTATVSQYFFYHWTTQQHPLSSVADATLRTGSTTSQIQINFKDGSYVLLSELNQSGGKERAVASINEFLGER